MTDVTVIIPWCDRPELTRTLNYNAADFAAAGAEVIIANCGGRRESLPGGLTAPTGIDVRWIDIAAPKFNKGLALNVGASQSGRDTLFLLDADILIEPGTISQLVNAMDKDIFVTVASVVESHAVKQERHLPPKIEAVIHAVELVTATGTTHRIVTNKLNLGRGARSGPGLALIWRKDFVKVGGMNSELNGWGWDDLDLIARLQMALGHHRREVGEVTHLSHSSAARNLLGQSKGESEGRNFLACLAAYSVGDLLGTYELDVARAASGLRVVELQ